MLRTPDWSKPCSGGRCQLRASCCLEMPRGSRLKSLLGHKVWWPVWCCCLVVLCRLLMFCASEVSRTLQQISALWPSWSRLLHLPAVVHFCSGCVCVCACMCACKLFLTVGMLYWMFDVGRCDLIALANSPSSQTRIPHVFVNSVIENKNYLWINMCLPICTGLISWGVWCRHVRNWLMCSWVRHLSGHC